jgi:2-aminoadipate transaminase
MSQGDMSRYFAARTGNLSASSIREICNLVGKKDLVSLAGGWPNPQTFPYAFTRRTIGRLMKEKKGDVLQYGSSEGLIQLRQWLAGWLKESEGIAATPDEIVITAGAQNGMELTCRILVEEGDVCLVELPTYFGATGSMRGNGGKLVGVPTDEGGTRVDEMAKILSRLRAEGKKVKLMYAQPLYHNPLGVNLAEDRKQVLLELAREYDFLIMEDNPYGDLCYEGKPQKPLKSLDRDGRIIYIKSFAKIFSPGIRMAAVAAHPDIASRMVVARQYIDCCPPNLSQYLLYEFCSSKMLEKHIRRLRRFYSARMKSMLAYIKEYFPPGVRYTLPKGGLFFFVYLPERIDAAGVFKAAMERKVVFVPGQQFYVDGSGANTMRLSFAQVDEDKMEAAIATIGKVLHEQL